MEFKSTIVGEEVLAKNIITFQTKFLAEVNKDMEAVRGLIDGALTRNISLSDHSLADLAAAGHPYSRARGYQIHQPSYAVHTQSGEMLAGKRSGTTPASVSSGKLVAAAWTGIVDSVPHAKYVLWGTTRMVPRDYLGGSRNEVKKESLDTLKRSLKNTVISFDGKKTKL